MKKYLEISGDYNDGDDITVRREITDERLEFIKPVIEAIKKYSLEDDYNWPTQEWSDTDPEEIYVNTGLITKEQYWAFQNYTPHGENGIHTIERIKLLYVEKEEELL